ncbi:hypothetical protein DSO57_1022571 [Entomophthora muscae]|uniref:Uncharacterized protein n=1 Tax=Entomophthora muscae TaxID=34485 RepID=A0ACC2U1M8_9FUNG|nr:hypothetical protein DSO57_1022571 [Entomophthora muscae]
MRLALLGLAGAALAVTCPGQVCVDIKPLKSSYQFTISGPPQTGYMAIGIGSSMTKSDMYVAWFDDNDKPIVSHRSASSYDAPRILSSAINITSSNIKQQSITFILSFPQPQAAATLQTNEPNMMIWAHSGMKPSSSGIIQKHTSEGAFSYSFQDETSLPSYLVWHAVLMIIAWLVLPSMAIFTARFLKDKLGPRWLTVHRILFFFTAVLAVTAICLVAFNIGNVLRDPHAIIGVIIMSLLGVQIVLGTVINKLWQPDRKEIPFHDKLHWFLGRTLALLAIGNIFYGIILINNPLAFWIPTIIILLVIIMMFIYGQIKIGKISH